MSGAPEPEDPSAAAQREVDRLHRKIEQLAATADPDKGGHLLLGIAKQKADNAGLAKRHATKIDAHIGGPKTTEAWLAQKAAEDNDDG